MRRYLELRELAVEWLRDPDALSLSLSLSDELPDPALDEVADSDSDLDVLELAEEDREDRVEEVSVVLSSSLP